jgi:hypothetical protein
MTNDNSSFSEERLNRIASRARENQCVKLIDLMYILAAEEEYRDLLFELWEAYDLNEKENNRIPGRICTDVNLKTKAARADAWYWLLLRLADTKNGRFFFNRLPEVKPLFPLYSDVTCKTEMENPEDRNEGHYVKLNNIVEGFQQIKKFRKLHIPLPSRLFPSNGLQAEQTKRDILAGRRVDESSTARVSEEEKVYKAIQRCKPEIEHWYNKLFFDLEPNDGQDWLTAFNKHALSMYDDGKYEQLKREWVDNCIYPPKSQKEELNRSNRKRDIIGRLCQQIVSDTFPDILPEPLSPPPGYSAKKLYYKFYRKS